MIERSIFDADHEAFRDAFRKFCDKEMAPHHDAWEEQGYVDRAVWDKAGENGYLCATLPEAYGGSGVDKLYSVVGVSGLTDAASLSSAATRKVIFDPATAKDSAFPAGMTISEYRRARGAARRAAKRRPTLWAGFPRRVAPRFA